MLNLVQTLTFCLVWFLAVECLWLSNDFDIGIRHKIRTDKRNGKDFTRENLTNSSEFEEKYEKYAKLKAKKKQRAKIRSGNFFNLHNWSMNFHRIFSKQTSKILESREFPKQFSAQFSNSTRSKKKLFTQLFSLHSSNQSKIRANCVQFQSFHVKSNTS